MGIDPRGLAMAMGDAEARLNAVREHANAMSAKAAGLDAVVTYQRARIAQLESELKEAHMESMRRMIDLEAALRKYGTHHDSSKETHCDWWANKPCNCGLDAALETVARSKSQQKRFDALAQLGKEGDA